ncbi:MAG: alpha/beta fold hydrolase [Pseudonocardia sp.]|nr:MAG: alpha/beta fold hydrolase [Pseudonocardia sp.]
METDQSKSSGTSIDRHSEERPGQTVNIGEISVHFHDLGDGPPLLIFPSFGPMPGTTAWLTYQKVLPELSKHYRCILIDLPNFGRTGPVVFDEPLHVTCARIAATLMDHLDIPRSIVMGNSIGGTVAIAYSLKYPDRVEKLVIGGCHASTGGDPYSIANTPSEGTRASIKAGSDPSPGTFRALLEVLIDDSDLVTDELVDTIFRNYESAPKHVAAWAESEFVNHSNLQDLHQIVAPTLVVHGRYDRMVPMEQGLTIMSYLPDSRLLVLNKCGNWPPFENPEEYTAHVLTFLETSTHSDRLREYLLARSRVG